MSYELHDQVWLSLGSLVNRNFSNFNQLKFVETVILKNYIHKINLKYLNFVWYVQAYPEVIDCLIEKIHHTEESYYE